MRAYTFTNFYLSSIQQGIQPAHCLNDMFIKYGAGGPCESNTEAYAKLLEWAAKHKTMICLNGGNLAGIEEIYVQLCELAPRLGLPFEKFHEDEQSLGGIMTCCGIIVPERIYEMAAKLRQDHIQTLLEGNYTDDEVSLAGLLNSYGLAK